MTQIKLSVRICKNIETIQIPQFIIGKRIIIQAHEIDPPKRAKDICDGHECDQTKAKGDVKFFSRSIDISKFIE